MKLFSVEIMTRILAFTVCLAIQACAERNDLPEYTNDMGEEIFGPGYEPAPPNLVPSPLLVGAPNAGAIIPEQAIRLRQDSLIVDKSDESDFPSAESSAILDQVPLRRAFSEDSADRSAFDSSDAAVQVSDSLDFPLAHANIHFVDVGQGDGAILEFSCGIAVIDTGGEFGGGARENGGQLFVDYLEAFFDERPQYNNTIDVLFSTHPHADHINGLPLISSAKNEEGDLLFKVKNVVDNGQTGDRGSLAKQTNFRKFYTDLGGGYSAVMLSRQISATGATNDVIDPINCEDVDPIFTVFWGGYDEDLAAEHSDAYRNPNNHSVIVRVDFGNASFLFTGDLEDKGELDLRNEFGSNLGVFDVDVYQVSHHGADDDTSDSWLDIMSPQIAVISMGKPDLKLSHTAWDHGHPRTGLLSILQEASPEEPGIVELFRDPAEQFLAAPQQETDFESTEISRAIYGTGWEGTVIITASSQGDYEIAVAE